MSDVDYSKMTDDELQQAYHDAVFAESSFDTKQMSTKILLNSGK